MPDLNEILDCSFPIGAANATWYGAFKFFDVKLRKITIKSEFQCSCTYDMCIKIRVFKRIVRHKVDILLIMFD